MFKNFFSRKKNKSEEKTSSNKHNLNELIEQSRNQILTHPLFMHYWSDNLPQNPNNPAWKNQAVFFWKGDEKFEKKSLPPEFKQYQENYFIINGEAQDLQFNRGKVMPWFGMEGNGDKHFFSQNGSEISIKELLKRKVIQYVELIEIKLENAAILMDRNNYFWLMNTEIIGYKNNGFQCQNKPISMSKAYEIEGLKLIKIKSK